MEHGFHWPILSSVGLDSLPDARVVVLRAATRETGTLEFHTDRRAPKIDQLRRQPKVALTFHDGPRKLQLRVNAHAECLLEGDAFEAAWKRTGPGSRRCYLAPLPPSEPARNWTPNLPSQFCRTPPSLRETEPGKRNFALVRCHVRLFDVLAISRHGHLRAGYEYDGGILQEALWVTP